jgi:hypothetical protein
VVISHLYFKKSTILLRGNCGSTCNGQKHQTINPLSCWYCQLLLQTGFRGWCEHVSTLVVKTGISWLEYRKPTVGALTKQWLGSPLHKTHNTTKQHAPSKRNQSITIRLVWYHCRRIDIILSMSAIFFAHRPSKPQSTSRCYSNCRRLYVSSRTVLDK